MTDLAFDQKVQRFLKFVIACRERYKVPPALFEQLGFEPEKMLKDEDARIKMITQAMPMILQSSPSMVFGTMYLRSFFETMTVEDRDALIENELLPWLDESVASIQSVIEFIKENKAQMNSDMRTIGAYLTLFTEGYLKFVPDQKKEQQ